MAFTIRFLMATPFADGDSFAGDYTLLARRGSLGNARRSSAPDRRSSMADYVAGLKLAVTFAGAAASTVTDCDCVPSCSCHNSRVYVPGGRPLISNVPSSLVTAKNGCATTLM